MNGSERKKKGLRERMKAISLFEEDLEEAFILGRGKGGQKINKTSSCVYLKHRPTSIEVKCQKGRSQEENRFLARLWICKKLEERLLGRESETRRKIYKIRKQKQKRTKRAQEKVLQKKKERGELKQLRRPPSS